MFKEAENRLSEQGLEKRNVGNALKELKELLGPVVRKHLGDVGARHKYYVGRYYPMLQRMATQWYKQFSRRMSVRCKALSPWKVTLEVSIPNELFSILKDIVLEINYGLYYSETKAKPKKCVIGFTSTERARNLLNRLMDTDHTNEDFLHKRFKGQRRIRRILWQEKSLRKLFSLPPFGHYLKTR